MSEEQTQLHVSQMMTKNGVTKKEEDMSALQRVEATCGLLAVLVGFLSLASGFFGFLFESSAGQSAAATLVQIAAVPIVLVFVAILLLGPIGVAVSAVQHSRTGDNAWRIVLWVATAITLFLIYLGRVSIGMALLPSGLFAMFACLLSLRVRTIR